MEEARKKDVRVISFFSRPQTGSYQSRSECSYMMLVVIRPELHSVQKKGIQATAIKSTKALFVF